MKTLKKISEKISNWYNMQEPEARLFLILITTIAAVGLIAMVVNFIYYGI